MGQKWEAGGKLSVSQRHESKGLKDAPVQSPERWEEGGKAQYSCPQEEPGQGSRSRNGCARGRMRNKGSVTRGVHNYS